MIDTNRILVIDTETTGLEPEQGAEVIELGMRMGLSDDAESKIWRIKPLAGIPAEATAINGITMTDVEKAPVFGEIANEVGRMIMRAEAIAGYNPDYDIRMLKAEFKRARLKVRWPEVVICSKRLWDIYQPRPPRDLQAAYREFVDNEGFEGAHSALKDARATAQVLRSQLKRFNLEETPLIELDPERKAWWCGTNHVLWDNGVLICNFGKNKGQPFHTLDYGMLKWILEKDFPKHVKDLATKVMGTPYKAKDPNTLAQDIAEWAKKR